MWRSEGGQMPRFARTSLAHSNCVHCAGRSLLYKCSSCVTGGSIRAAVSDVFENRAGKLAVLPKRLRSGYSNDLWVYHFPIRIAMPVGLLFDILCPSLKFPSIDYKKKRHTGLGFAPIMNYVSLIRAGCATRRDATVGICEFSFFCVLFSHAMLHKFSCEFCEEIYCVAIKCVDCWKNWSRF